ncbi:hypothetical protein, partial [Thiolapillus sp.]|uniref:hypothetical protein n=1 Tax=Thiolapillus sp. TaxID=2017437 RepID=UPI003AF42478
GTPGKQCGLAATGVYQPSLRSPWLAATRIRSTIRRLEGISSPTQVFREIEHQVTCGLYRDKPLFHAVNICLSLLRQGRWTTPWDFPAATVEHQSPPMAA